MNIKNLSRFWRRPKSEAPIQLHRLFVLRSNDYPCSRCILADKDCFKLIFHNHTICATNRENVNSYIKSRK